MTSSSSIVEIRIPTYNRPAFLRRALKALLAQTYENWRAVVLDDGDAARTREVLNELGDGRILQSPNRERLGPDRNIIRAFSRQPMAGGAYFYVLEDDNLIVPTFIEDNLRWLSTHDVGLVINNQWVEVPPRGPEPGSPTHANEITIDCFTEGVWSADDFKVALLWRMPISNGSIFWRSNCLSDFTVDDKHDPALHEWLRAYRVADAIYFNETPNAFWYPSPESANAASSYLAGMSVYLMRERAVQTMRRQILAELRRRGELQKLLSERYRTPLPVREEGVRKAYGRWPAASSLPLPRRAELLAKALLLRGVVSGVPLH